MRADFHTVNPVNSPERLTISTDFTEYPTLEIYSAKEGVRQVKLTPEILNFFRTWKPEEKAGK